MGKTPVFRFILLLLSALMLQGLPWLFFTGDGDGALSMYLLHLYLVLPLAAALLPYWAGLGGVHPMAGFFPVGGALWLFPVYESPAMALACMGISLVACVAGQERKKRLENGKKGNHHGGTNGKKAKK